MRFIDPAPPVLLAFSLSCACVCACVDDLGQVRTIERARGAKAKEKMLVFSHVLRARGKTDLLQMAEAALDRLVRGVPMPEQES